MYRHVRRIAEYTSDGKEIARSPVWRVTPSDRDTTSDGATSVRATLHVERLDADERPVTLSVHTSADGEVWVEIDAFLAEFKGVQGRLTRDLPVLRYIAVQSEGPTHRVRAHLAATSPFELDAVAPRSAGVVVVPRA